MGRHAIESLPPLHRAVFDAVPDGGSGLLTGDIAAIAIPGEANRRRASATARRALESLLELGLVCALDDEKPTVWTRTDGSPQRAAKNP